jgi:hypothetical protein
LRPWRADRRPNYLVPIDAELAREVDVDDETVTLDRAIRAVS